MEGSCWQVRNTFLNVGLLVVIEPAERAGDAWDWHLKSGSLGRMVVHAIKDTMVENPKAVICSLQ